MSSMLGMNTIFCEECGTQVRSSNAKFCSSCGERLSALNVQTELLKPSATATQEDSSFTAENQFVAKKTSKGPYGVGGFLLLLIIGLGFIGPLFTLASIGPEITLSPLARQNISTAQLNEWVHYQTATWIIFGFGITCSLYGAYTLHKSRKREAVIIAKRVLWIIGPILTLVHGFATVVLLSWVSLDLLLQDMEPLGQLLKGLIVTIVWTFYLSKSRRVRNTYTE